MSTPLIEFRRTSRRMSLSNGGSVNIGGDLSVRPCRVLVVEVCHGSSPCTPHCILIAYRQDNMINQRLLIKLLTILQCDTRACKDGQECVDLLVSLACPEGREGPIFGRFDLILMDLEMYVCDPILCQVILILHAGPCWMVLPPHVGFGS
jgi:CheY-like chemotaxis protein